MSNQSTASAREITLPTTETRSDGGFPLRFHGRARLVLDRDALIARVREELQRAARPDLLDEDRVRAYCADRGIAHHRFESALLSEAFKVVSSDRLIDRLTDDLRARMPAALESAYRCSAERRDGVLVLRLGASDYGEPRYVIVGEEPEWAVIPGFASVHGTLSLDGSLARADAQPLAVTAAWRVAPGATCASFGRNAGSCFAPQVRVLVGCLAGDALSRFSRALPGTIAGVLGDSREPTFVNVERLLRLGRLTHSTRVYLLYWKRLRDYLIWSVAG